MRTRLLLLALSSFLPLSVAGCGGGEDVEPTLSSIYDVIIERSCNSESCHGGSNPEAGLDLTSVEAAYASLVGVTSTEEPSFTRVIAGDPDNSLMYMVLLGDVGAVGQMPSGWELGAVEIEAIRQWIEDGAENN
jgi:hypothetical protein